MAMGPRKRVRPRLWGQGLVFDMRELIACALDYLTFLRLALGGSGCGFSVTQGDVSAGEAAKPRSGTNRFGTGISEDTHFKQRRRSYLYDAPPQASRCRDAP